MGATEFDTGIGCDMKSYSTLFGGTKLALTKPCFSQQVFHGSRRLTGGHKLLSRVWSLPGNVANLEASIRASALESDDRVKLNEHSQASLL